MNERGRKRGSADITNLDAPLRSDGFLSSPVDISSFDFGSVPFSLPFPDFAHVSAPLFDSPPLYPLAPGPLHPLDMQTMAKAFMGYLAYDHQYPPGPKYVNAAPREFHETVLKDDESSTAGRTLPELVADPSYVVPVGGFEVRVVVVSGRALYCANDVMMAVGIKTSVRSTLYKLREKYPDLCRFGVLTKLSGSITGQAMTCYPLRVCCSDCPPKCQYETCQGFKPLDVILASLGRAEVIKLFVTTERELEVCPTFVWPTSWWRDRIKKAEAQRDLKRALNAANKRDRRDKLLHLADVACIAGSANQGPQQV